MYCFTIAFELWDLSLQQDLQTKYISVTWPVSALPMPPKKGAAIAAWVTSTPAPVKAKVPKVSYLNKLTSSDWKGILYTVEGIDPEKFDTLATKNFSNWEDVRTTLGVEPAVITRLQDRLAELPQVRGWIENPPDFAAKASQPEVAPLESAAKSAISKRSAAQGLTDELLEKHKHKKHASYEAMRDVKVRKSRARTGSRTCVSPSAVWCDMAA